MNKHIELCSPGRVKKYYTTHFIILLAISLPLLVLMYTILWFYLNKILVPNDLLHVKIMIT